MIARYESIIALAIYHGIYRRKLYPRPIRRISPWLMLNISPHCDYLPCRETESPVPNTSMPLRELNLVPGNFNKSPGSGSVKL